MHNTLGQPVQEYRIELYGHCGKYLHNKLNPMLLKMTVHQRSRTAGGAPISAIYEAVQRMLRREI